MGMGMGMGHQQTRQVNRPVVVNMGSDGSSNGNFDGNFNGNGNSGDRNGNLNGNLDGNLNGNDVNVRPKATSTDGSSNGNFDGNFNGNNNSGDENGNFNGNKDGNLNGNTVSNDWHTTGGDAMDLSQLPPNRQSDFNSMNSDRNSNGGGGGGGNRNGNNMVSQSSSSGGGLNRGADPNQVRQYLGSDEFAAATTGTSVLASQCMTQVSFVPVHCGDVVSITLDAEDACLAENFADDKPFMTQHTFSENDFMGGRNSLRNSFTEQGFVSRTSFDATAVRGTNVQLEVLVEDECGNVGKANSDPSEQCDAFVSGKCCPVIANGISQFARNQVLANAPQIHGMIQNPPVQLTDVLNSKLHIDTNPLVGGMVGGMMGGLAGGGMMGKP